MADGVEANPGQVKVTMRFGPEVKTAWVRVPVGLEMDGDQRAQTGVRHVRVQVEAPVPSLREAEAGRDIPDLKAVLRLPGGLKPGRHTLKYEVEAPEGFRVLARQPETLPVVIHK
jgi:hypothetical protein